MFGAFAHEVLSTFANSTHAQSSSVKEIRTFLWSELDRLSNTTFGKTAAPAVYVQLEQLRARFSAFAEWQAGWFDAGWRIQHSELLIPPDEFDVKTSKGGLGVTGRIDRVDVHERDGKIAVVDYKTSENAIDPFKAHVSKDGWLDVQLPLYQLMLQRRGLTGMFQTGYVSLSSSVDALDVGWVQWSDEQLVQVNEVIARVAECIAAEQFWPPREIPEYRDDFGLLCQFYEEERAV